ncbi:MAG: glycosyltransferase family 4 protein [Pseudomonadota bacterium]
MASGSLIVFVISGDLWGGAESMALNLAAALAAEGAAVMALTFNHGLTSRRLEQAGIETRVVAETAGFAAMATRAARLLRGRGVGVLHSHGYKENLLAAAVAPLLHRPRLVSTVHGLSETLPALGRWWPALKRSLVEGLNYAVLARCFTTVAVSGAVRRALLERHRLPAGRVELIFNGIPLPDEAPPGEDLAPAVGSVGRLYPVKNFLLFLEVAALVCSRRPEVRFRLLGDGPQRPQLEEFIRRRGLEGRVEMLGFQPDPAPFYRTLSLYLNTSLHEGMPLAVLEAMARGLPVVAPNVGGLPELIENGVDGLLARPLHAEDMADNCLKLLGDAALRRRLGQAARAKVERRFSAGAMAQEYRRLYARLTEGRIH